MKQVVLDDVADSASLIVETAPSLHAERLRHCDLNAFHEVAVPDRLKKRVRKAKEQQVLNGILAKEVIDAENILLGKDAVVLTFEIFSACEDFHAAMGVSWDTVDRSAVRIAVMALRPAVVS